MIIFYEIELTRHLEAHDRHDTFIYYYPTSNTVFKELSSLWLVADEAMLSSSEFQDICMEWQKKKLRSTHDVELVRLG